jgi:hypothetical protein
MSAQPAVPENRRPTMPGSGGRRRRLVPARCRAAADGGRHRADQRVPRYRPLPGDAGPARVSDTSAATLAPWLFPLGIVVGAVLGTVAWVVDPGSVPAHPGGDGRARRRATHTPCRGEWLAWSDGCACGSTPRTYMSMDDPDEAAAAVNALVVLGVDA